MRPADWEVLVTLLILIHVNVLSDTLWDRAISLCL